MLTPLPLYHIFSLTANLLAFALMGGLSVLVPDPRDLKGLIRTMRRAQVTTMTGVNTLFNALINTPDFAAARFQQAGLRHRRRRRGAKRGGAALARDHRRDLVEGYGLTEASPVVCINPVRSAEARHCRPAGSSTEVAIRDDAGNDVAVGEHGEICVRGPQVMQGYWQRPDETRLVLDRRRLAAHRRYRRVRRAGILENPRSQEGHDQRLRLQGFPNEVEDVVAQHPGVLEAAVIGVADEHTGQAVKLFVVRRDPERQAEELTRFAANGSPPTRCRR